MLIAGVVPSRCKGSVPSGRYQSIPRLEWNHDHCQGVEPSAQLVIIASDYLPECSLSAPRTLFEFGIRAFRYSLFNLQVVATRATGMRRTTSLKARRRVNLLPQVAAKSE